MRRVNLLGKRFGRLLVVSEAPKQGKHIKWNCLCDCGKIVVVFGDNIRRGLTKSCGCLHSEITRQKNSTHKESKTRLYSIWISMKERCSNNANPDWKNYGGRGISVCDKWRNSYESFRDWSRLNGYNDNLTIDRIDVNGNYTPENCRWATTKDQNRNKRSNVLYKGKCISVWCEKTGIDKRTVHRRINVYGWPVEKALFTPVMKSKIRISTQQGEN